MTIEALEAETPEATVRTSSAASADDRAVSELDQAASIFCTVRPRLFGIAYQLLRSVSEAEDIVQEVWLRWQRTDRTVVMKPTAFLATTTTRLALNVLQSARVRRERYVGPHSQPVDGGLDPERSAEQGEAVAAAVLLLLEKLTPRERAVYVLREAFDYPYSQISEALHLDTANARQLVSRAHKRIAAERRQPVNSLEYRRLLCAFVDAAQVGNLAALEDLLAEDIAS